jgi:polyisoprenoid-binding protein YceI
LTGQFSLLYKTKTMKWKVDPAHSEVQFRVKHLMITNVTGYFKKFDVEVETDSEDFRTAKNIVFTADVASIDTNNADRDAHLRSQDFFNAEKHNDIKFIGKKYEVKGGTAKLHGELTIRDTTRPVDLDVEFGGIVDDPYGQHKAGFTVTGKISRKEFGLNWNAVTEAGKIVVSDEIRIHCDIQLVEQKSEVKQVFEMI